MSSLPKHKKSAEEIAKLRESLGILEVAPDAPPIPDTEVSSGPESKPETPPHPSWPYPTHSLKKSEWVSPQVPPVAAGNPKQEMTLPPPQTHPERMVHSLRKSEQVPVLAVPKRDPVPADSPLPIRRHADEELQELRRHAALELATAAVPNPKFAKAHLALVLAGYLTSLAGAVCFQFFEQPISVSASCVAVSLLIATFIFFRKPISRHHAAFISVMALAVIITGAFHYFPQLEYAT